jgi:hypothetical protein
LGRLRSSTPSAAKLQHAAVDPDGHAATGELDPDRVLPPGQRDQSAGVDQPLL